MPRISIMRMRLAGILGCLAAVWGSAACGGGASTTAREPAASPSPTRSADRSAGQPATATGEEATRPGGAPAEPGSAGNGIAPVSEAECQALLAHVVAVANAAHVEKVAPELAPTDEQLAEIRAGLAPRFVPACLTMDRRAFACEMRAQSREALLACAGPPAAP